MKITILDNPRRLNVNYDIFEDYHTGNFLTQNHTMNYDCRPFDNTYTAWIHNEYLTVGQYSAIWSSVSDISLCSIEIYQLWTNEFISITRRNDDNISVYTIYPE